MVGRRACAGCTIACRSPCRAPACVRAAWASAAAMAGIVRWMSLLPSPSAAIIGAVPRRVVLVAFPDVQSLDVVGPAEVFSVATRLGPGEYEIELVAPGGGPVT